MPDYGSPWIDRRLGELVRVFDEVRRVAAITSASVQGREHAALVVVRNSVTYFEIGKPDLRTSQKFYRDLMGWTISGEPKRCQTVHMANGGLYFTSVVGDHSRSIFYLEVDDVRAATNRARDLGGKVLIPVNDDGKIEFAHLCDPHGNRFGIWHRHPSDEPN